MWSKGNLWYPKLQVGGNWTHFSNPRKELWQCLNPVTVLQEHTACGKGYLSPLAMSVISVLSPLAMGAYTLKEKKQENNLKYT